MLGRLTQEELADFTEFAQARQRHLMRTAYLLCGNRQSAQDLTQTALLDLCRAGAGYGAPTTWTPTPTGS